MAKIHLNNCDYYYELSGKGHPVVLIAGYVCDHTFWNPILSHLSRNFQVLVFDNRGIGQTKDSQVPLSAELMAEDVMMLADALGLVKPHIVGHSMGGTIAQCIGSKYSSKISKLSLLCTSPKWRAALILSTLSLLAMRQQNCSFELIADATLPWIFGENFLNDHRAVEELKKKSLENPYPQSIQDQARQHAVLVKYDGLQRLKNILVETLIIHGSQDVASLPAESSLMARTIPNCTLKELNCGHGMIAELPEELGAALTDFLTKV